MEVVKPWEDIEPETEDFGMALRERLPRQQTTTDDESPAIITTSTEIFTSSKFDDDKDNDDKSSSFTSSDGTQSDDDVKETNGNGVLHGENGHGNGVAKSAHGHSGLDDRYVDFLGSEESPVDHRASDFEPSDSASQPKVEVNSRNVGEIETVVEESQEENGDKETVEYMEARLRKKIEEEFRELYLDKLSDNNKQGQHEFYCPNCKACITKVLVREKEQEPEPVAVGFRCTSCFSFLIPIGDWLFPKWRVHEDEEIMTNNEVPVSFSGLREPLLQSNNTPVPNVVTTITTTTTTTTTQPVPTRDFTEEVEIPGPKQPIVTSVTTKITGLNEPAPPSPWRAVLFGQKARAAAVKSKTPTPEEPIAVVSVPETPSDSEKIGDYSSQDSNGSEAVYDLHYHHRRSPVVSAAIAPIETGFEGGAKLELSLPPQDSMKVELDQSVGDILIVRNKTPESEIGVIPVSAGELPMLQEVIVHSGTKLDIAVQGVDSAGAEHPQTTTVTIGTRDTTLVLEPGVPKSWEIVKSIVYGGLVESITSLGIVTSAASGDATTLNIVALALANLIGGLFLIAHNIWELRVDQSTARCTLTNNRVNKYQEVLGRRENFFLHATFAILSFVLFGLVPPIVYGFSFSETGDKDLKIAAVGVASLISISILAIGKAYIQRPNKYVKTVVYYLVIGFGVSGASYLAGELISQLLKKIESSSNTTLSNGLWGSY